MSDDKTYDIPASALEADGASDYNPKRYEVAPEDLHIAAEIAATDPMSLPSSARVKGAIKFPSVVPITALSPQMRASVETDLRGVPAERREAAERVAVQKVLRENGVLNRSRSGFDESVGPYWQEMAAVTSEYNSLLAEYDRLNEQMSEVAGWETEEGPDGKPVPKAVPVMSELALRSAASRQAELLYRMGLLANKDGSHGPEAKRRLAQAMVEEVAMRKERAMEAAALAEAKRRREEREFEKRVASKGG